MNTKNRPFGIVARLPAVLCAAGLMGTLTTGCAPEKPSDVELTELEVEEDQELEQLEAAEAVVARLGGDQLSREQFDRRLEGLADFAAVQLQSDRRREAFLERMVEFEVLADEAQRRNLGDHPRTRHALKETMVNLMVEDHLRDEVSIADVDDQARREYFEQHRDELHESERRRLARVVVDDEQRAEQLVERWEDERPDGDDLEDTGVRFRRFAFLYSEERQTGDEGGDAGWREPDDPQVFGEDVFEWEPGRLKGPFEQDGRWVLKMVVERQQPHRPSVDELEERLTREVFEQWRDEARRQFVDELRADADIDIHHDRLEQLQPPSPTPPPQNELPRVAPEHTD